ncbi:phage tail protein [Microbulbifer spongiae]|uniref:Phage tail protein n=1 Tax=Microbulbifer spongiae TaxID=2944933 RepID=A0ABY9E8K9_9GAMM|nr:phage tail protein [Microbulbifer sp. MI-G]WKD48662.1 phage tail protein [Microbulbifer sp. MI-G]
MIKPDSLRAFMKAAVPHLRCNPEILKAFLDRGALISTGVPGFAFEYLYTLNVLLTDYAGHLDAVVVPLLVWISEQQPELFHNPDLHDQIHFEAELLDQGKMDLSVEISLTERVGVIPREGGGFAVEHYPEPQEDPPGRPPTSDSTCATS